MPGQDDIYLKVVNHSFDYAVGQADHQRNALLALYADTRLAGQILQQFRATANVDGANLSFATPVGEIKVDFVPATSADYFCWAAVFRADDEYGKQQDLYSVRLGWDKMWNDSTGVELALDEMRGGVSTVTAFQCLQRAIAARLRKSEERIAKLDS